MKTMAAGRFKACCLAVLDEVAATRETVVVTKYGKPVATLTPCAKRVEGGRNPLKGSILFEDDIVSPVDAKWEALT